MHPRPAPTRGPRPAAAISALVLVLVGAAALVVLALRPDPAPEGHFVQTFAGTAATAAQEVEPAATTTVSGVRMLTMQGGWTSVIGEQIARRALRWVGTPYSFAGGNAEGPTLGTPVDDASRNDGHITGFDCSGLVLYALAPWRGLTHFAATQYTQAGQVHPSRAQLLPGDLVFWSTDGTVEGVGHVAIYVGDGKVVQAPHSGDVVRVTPLDQVEDGAIGTVRPLTTA